MSKNKVIWIIIAVVVLLVLWWVISGFDGDADVNIGDNGGGPLEDFDDFAGADNMDDDDEGGDDSRAPITHTIEMSSSGFSPSSLIINVGDIVMFVAVDGSNRWPASDLHPTHRTYPGSDIAKCGGADESSIFDSCGAIANGESYIFEFTEVGDWSYHDHFGPGKKGTITVVG